jgi:hypothetical protein
MFLLPDKLTPFTILVPPHLPIAAVADATNAKYTFDDVFNCVCDIQRYLETSGWINCTAKHTTPEFWQEAAAADQVETCHTYDSASTSVKGLFRPCGLLPRWIAHVESELQHGAIAAGPFFCLDVGCGSGRDLAWVAQRSIKSRTAVAAAAASGSGRTSSRQADGTSGTSSAAEGAFAAAAVPSTSSTRTSTSDPISHNPLQWHVTGVDSWPGAVERAQLLLQSMCVHSRDASFLLGNVDSSSGLLQQLPVPAKYRRSGGGKQGGSTTAGQQQGSQAPPAGGAQTGLEHAATQQQQEQQVQSQEEQQDGAASLWQLLPNAVLPYGLATSAAVRGRGYHLAVCVRFLERGFLPRLAEMLLPGGFLLYSTFLDAPGTRAFGRPSGQQHLLQPGELAEQYFGPAQGFRVLCDEVYCLYDGREVCMFVACKL